MEPISLVDIDSLTNELIVTKMQLSSKCEAIGILKAQLENANRDVEQFKAMSEQLQARYRNLKMALSVDSGILVNNESCQQKLIANFKVKLCEFEMQNRILEAELSNLRRRNSELLNDIAILKQSTGVHQSWQVETINEQKDPFVGDERESLISQLELKNFECQRLIKELELCKEEKQDIVSDLIQWKCSECSGCKGAPSSVDVHAVLQEKKILLRRISRLEADKKLLTSALAKYQNCESIANLFSSLEKDTAEGEDRHEFPEGQRFNRPAKTSDDGLTDNNGAGWQ